VLLRQRRRSASGDARDVQVYSDGSVSVLSGSTEIGQGSHTILTANCRGRNGCAARKVRLVGSDRQLRCRTLHRRKPHHHSDGRAVLEACREAIAQCKRMAADMVESFPRRIDGRAWRHTLRRTHMTWPENPREILQMEGCSIIGRAYLRKAGDLTLVRRVLGNRCGRRGDRAGTKKLEVLL